MNPSELHGVIAAAATPVHPDYKPDLSNLVAHLTYLLEDGCDGINLLGTTGEANSFSMRQRLEIMHGVKHAGLPLARFMVGTGVCSLEETVVLTRAAGELGFAGALVLPPFFYPGVQGDALVQYVDELVKRLGRDALSLYLYHIPQNTGVAWPIDVVANLGTKYSGLLRGIKDSSGDLSYSRGVVAAAPDLQVYPSSEATLSTAGEAGFAGCISATTNLTAAASQTAWRARGTDAGKEAGERAAVQRAILGREALVSSVKAALAVRYSNSLWSVMCPPLLPRTAAQTITLAQELRAAGMNLPG